MGSTNRAHRYQIPLPTRSTDVTSAEQCFGKSALTWFYEKEQAEASFFGLGSALHESIERAILEDLDLEAGLADVRQRVATFIVELEESEKRVIESSQRGVETMYDDAERMMTNWFKFAHPDSPKRHPIYADYQWPPKGVEMTFERTARSARTRYPVWGSIDAFFEGIIPETYLIVDWKSGTQKQKSDFQLNFYRFGMKLPEARAVFHHLDRVQKPSIIQEASDYPGDEDIREQIVATESVKLALIDGKYPEFVPDWYCNYCTVQEFCPVDGEGDHKANRKKLERMVDLAVPLSIVKRKEENGS